MKPAIQFLELIVDKPDKIFREYIIKEENRKAGKLPITYYLDNEENGIDFDDFANEINKQCSEIKKLETEEKKPKRVIKRIIKKI